MTVERFDLRPRWRREVAQAPRIKTATKVVLLVLGEHMRPDLKVSVSRRTLADEMGWHHRRRVSYHLSAARDAGFLVTLTEGAYGRTATWRGVIPDRPTDSETRTVDGSVESQTRHLTDDLADQLRVRKTSTLTDVAFPHPCRALRVRKTSTPLLETTPGPQPQTAIAVTRKPQPPPSCLCSRRRGLNVRAA